MNYIDTFVGTVQVAGEYPPYKISKVATEALEKYGKILNVKIKYNKGGKFPQDAWMCFQMENNIERMPGLAEFKIQTFECLNKHEHSEDCYPIKYFYND